jgi:hypothetical protein
MVNNLTEYGLPFEYIESIYPPFLGTNLKGERIIDAVGFCHFLVVTDDRLTLDILRSYWINPYKIIKSEIKTFNVPSSDGKKDYTVKLENGVYSCDCKGFMFRNSCGHIDTIKEGQKIDLTPATRYIWKSDTGKTKYTVSERSGKWSCSCSGFKKKGSCKHIDEVRSSH